MILKETIFIGDIKGRIDHLYPNSQKNWLYVAALGNDSLEIVDLTVSKHIKTIKGFQQPQGVIFISESNRIYVTNGGNGEVDVLDADNFSVIGRIALGEDADNIRYDPLDKKIYIGAASSFFVVNAMTNQVTAQISLKGHPEAFEIEEKGSRIFINVPSI